MLSHNIGGHSDTKHPAAPLHKPEAFLNFNAQDDARAITLAAPGGVGARSENNISGCVSTRYRTLRAGSEAHEGGYLAVGALAAFSQLVLSGLRKSQHRDPQEDAREREIGPGESAPEPSPPPLRAASGVRTLAGRAASAAARCEGCLKEFPLPHCQHPPKVSALPTADGAAAVESTEAASTKGTAAS